MRLVAPTLLLVALLLAVSSLTYATPLDEKSIADAGEVDWAHLTSESLAAVSPAAFRTLNASDFASMPEGICDGLQLAQMQNLGAACSGIPRNCMWSITAEAVAGMQVACLTAIPGDGDHFSLHEDATSALPVQLIKHISPAQWNEGDIYVRAMTASQLAQLSLPVCSSMRMNQFEGESCSGLTAACMQVVRPSAFQGMEAYCLGSFSVSALAALSMQQAAELSRYSGSFSLLPAASAAHLSRDFCSGLSGAALSADGMGSSARYGSNDMTMQGLSGACLDALSDDACAEMDGTLLTQFSADTSIAPRLASLTPTCVAAFNCSLPIVGDGLGPGSDPALAPVRAALNAVGLQQLLVCCHILPEPAPAPVVPASAGDTGFWHSTPGTVLIALAAVVTVALIVLMALYLQRRHYLSPQQQGESAQFQARLLSTQI